jgi:hypothetical protein
MPLDGSTVGGQLRITKGQPARQVAGENRENVFVVLPTKFTFFIYSQDPLADFNKVLKFQIGTRLILFYFIFMNFLAVLHAPY